MKTQTSKISVKIADTNDEKRTFKIVKDETGWLAFGSGRNPDYPQLMVHPDDVEQFIATINAVVKSKLPTEL